ncbi:MAG: sulfurtransferase [Gammaproteobacteria bacterium]|nr:sulfurtransferase [Gammaproteobacteria bacterium]
MTPPLLPLLCEPQQLADLLGDPRLLVVDLSRPEIYAVGHVPGAVSLPYSAIVTAQPPVMGLLPDVAQLSEVLSRIGLTPDRHVVAYDDEPGGKASRLLWTLAAVGHPHFSLLNGGISAWQAGGLKLSSRVETPTPSEFAATIDPAPIADRAWIEAHLDDSEVVVLDVRSAAEYQGREHRAGRNGHIPGAINIEWSLAVKPDQATGFPMAPEPFGKALSEAGITPDKTVVVHCHSHHRSSHSFVALKALGYDKVKGYPGSWSDWGNQPDTPIED